MVGEVMKNIDFNMHIDALVKRYPMLEQSREQIIIGFNMLKDCYEQGGKILIAGNGGSAADAEHLAGELMKKLNPLQLHS